MINANQFKNGLTIELDGQVYSIVEFQPVKPGKGGAFVRTKLKNLRNKKILEKTFRAEERFQEAFVEEKKMQYLYNAHQMYHFMDKESFEELIVAQEKLDAVMNFLKENMEISIVLYQNKVIDIKLPIFIKLKVVQTEPGIRGDTSRSSYKPAILETGANIQIPLFINIDDVIKVDTRTGSYVERA